MPNTPGASDKFQAAPGGGLPVQVTALVTGPNKELGKQFNLGATAPMAPAMTQTPAVPSHNQAQIGQSNAPKGAQPVSLMGQAPQGQPILGQGPKSVSRMPMAPAPQMNHMLGASENEVHTIVVEGRAPDNRIYTAEYDAVFPKGTVVLGAKLKK